MLKTKEDLDYNEVVYWAYKLLEHIVNKHSIKSFSDFTCFRMRALAREFYYEVD